MVGIVIVSHSFKVADGIYDLAMEMAPENEHIIAAGGMADGNIGTDAFRIMSAIEARKLAEENEARWAAEEEARSHDDDDDDNSTSAYVREAEARQEREEENRGRHRDRSSDRRTGSKRFEEAEQNTFSRGSKKGGKAGKSVKGAAKLNQQQHGFNRPAAPVTRDVEIGETITVADLAAKMAVKATEVAEPPTFTPSLVNRPLPSRVPKKN